MFPNERLRGDELLAKLLQGHAGGGEIENRLLAELQGEYPIEKLRLLLRSSDGNAVGAGIWLASELGASARSLFEDVTALIEHPSPQVRFFALDYLTSCAEPGDETAIMNGLHLLEDQEESVRWKALIFLTAVSEGVLKKAQHLFRKADANGSHAKGLDLLVNAVVTGLSDDAVAHLESSDMLLRSYAAAVTVRVASHNPAPLGRAMRSHDLTVKQFAEDMAIRMGIAPV